MKKTRHTLFWMAGILALLALLPQLSGRVARAQTPQAVELEDFDAFWDPDEGAVVLDWVTATEFNSAGFQVRRVTSVARPLSTSDDDLIVVTDEDDEDIIFIPANGDSASGGFYTVIDYDIDFGVSYWYFLVEIDLSGNVVVFDGVDGADFARQVWAADSTPTATPPSLATPTPPAGATAQPTASPSPTLVPQTSPTPGGLPTATPAANSTATPTVALTATGNGLTATPGVQPSATLTAGGFSGPTPTPFSFGNPGGSDEGDEIAQVNSTPGAYPGPGDEGDDGSYPGGEPPAPALDPNATATGYPLDAAPPAETNTGAGTIGGIGYEAAPADAIGNGATTTSAALGDQAAPASSQSLLLWVGFVVALVLFAGGIFGSIILFTRRRAP